jgi:CRISPR-associated protein Cas2
MLIVTYDIHSDFSRNRFSKFLSKFGDRIQLSVFKIKNSKRILNAILSEVEYRYKKEFRPTDSIYIFNTCDGCTKKIHKYGSAKYEDAEVVYLE